VLRLSSSPPPPPPLLVASCELLLPLLLELLLAEWVVKGLGGWLPVQRRLSK
jgi:hypothetical protein